MRDKRNTMVWVDLETTGLDPKTCQILQVGIVVTNAAMEEQTCIEKEVYYPPEVLAKMEEWPTQQHAKSGLTEKCCRSPHDLEAVEDILLKYLEHSGISRWNTGIYPMCGSSVHFDRAFLREHMPKLHDFFHYRNIDVSTIHNLKNLWYPDFITPRPPKDGIAHTALSDLRNSIAELKYYKKYLLR